MAESYEVFGRSLPRVDALDKLTGKATYAGDISLTGMLSLKVLRSNRAHARILGIHTEKAKTHPGVVAVLTSRDIPGTNRTGPRIKDQPVLCDDRVRFVGDPVVLVAAETLKAAEEAVILTRVDYEDLPGIFSPEEAVVPDAVNIHESGNILLERDLTKGDPDKALKEAALVITNTYRTQMVEHAYLEPEAGVAKYENDRVTVWMPSKHPHFEQKEIAGVLGLPNERVRVILATVGGSFGDKQCLSAGYYAALGSLKTGRPCKMVYTREESFVASTKRHPMVIHYTTGATREGRIIAAEVEIIADTGAYSSYGPSTLLRSLIHAPGPYDIPNVHVRGRAVFTNNPIAGAMRGFGVPQVVVAHETQVDILAESLKMDPFEIRLKNGLRPGSCTGTGQVLKTSVGLSQTIERVRGEITRRGVPISFGSKRYAWGIASMFYGLGNTALPNPGISRIEARDSGDYTLYLGCGDMGQGAETAMTQIAAEVLKSTPEKIGLCVGDTDLCPDSGTSSASRVTYVVGRSVQLASENLREILLESAAEILGIEKEDVLLDKGYLFPSESQDQKVSVSEVVRKLKRDGRDPLGRGAFNPETTALDLKTSQGSPYGAYAFATQGALVAVNMRTGEIDVLDIVACHDVGKTVNPVSVAGQIEGAVSMGVGYGLMEEVLVQEGAIKNPRFSEYFVPTAQDLPQVTSLFVESEEPTGPFGAKGVGEPALLSTAPAILNAIAAATGVRIKEIPATSEKLWKLLSPHGKRKVVRDGDGGVCAKNENSR